MGKITRESWDFIVENIIYIVMYNEDLDTIYNELEDYLTGEGIIEIIEEGE